MKSLSSNTGINKIIFYQIDAFTEMPFAGNPAAVCISSNPLPDALMQNIAREMNLSETAFLSPLVEEDARGDYSLRWFTPETEVSLCGHATLAAAAALHAEGIMRDEIGFHLHRLNLPASVSYSNDGFTLNFPADKPVPLANAIFPTGKLPEALGIKTENIAILWGTSNRQLLVEISSKEELLSLNPDQKALLQLRFSDSSSPAGLIVTAPGEQSGKADFYSRFFDPWEGIPEDPVTGSAHCLLTPYWAEKLGKSELIAHQLSSRGGEILCRLLGDKVELTGKAVIIASGHLSNEVLQT